MSAYSFNLSFTGTFDGKLIYLINVAAYNQWLQYIHAKSTLWKRTSIVG